MFWSPLPTCPLLAMHSGAVMQVPLSPVVELHTALGKFTIEKRLQDKYYQILYFTAFRVGRCWGGGEGEGIGEAWEASYKRFSYLDSARKKISHLNIFSCLVMSWLVFVFCQAPCELIIRQASTRYTKNIFDKLPLLLVVPPLNPPTNCVSVTWSQSYVFIASQNYK